MKTADVGRWYNINHKSRDLTHSSVCADVYYAAGYRPTPATIRVVTALLGDLCTIDSDCGVKYSRCVGGACVCKDGHAETPDRQECLGENVHWFVSHRSRCHRNIYCVMRIRNWVISVTSLGLNNNNNNNKNNNNNLKYHFYMSISCAYSSSLSPPPQSPSPPL